MGEKYAHWLPKSDQSLRYWVFFEASDFVTMPYAGGLADQPKWVLDDFAALSEITEYNELLVELEYLERRLLNV